MFLFNVSVIIEPSAHIPVLNWIEDVLAKQSIDNLHFLKMLDSPHEGHTYCLQLVAKDQAQIESFRSGILLSLRQFITDEYADKVFVFDSTMQYM